MKDAQIVGEALASVLPKTDKYWFQQRHLLALNLLLVVPLLSSSTSGYDGSLMNGLQSLDQWETKFGHPVGVMLGLVNAAQAIGRWKRPRRPGLPAHAGATGQFVDPKSRFRGCRALHRRP